MNTQPPLTTSLDERIPSCVDLSIKGRERFFSVFQSPKASNCFQACRSLFERCVGETKCRGKLIKVKEGIETEPAKKISQSIKDSKLKVQSSIQDAQVRVSGKNRDDLQKAMQLVRTLDLNLELQFINFRD